MYKLETRPCRKCGGDTSIHWDRGEKSSGMDIHKLRPEGMVQTCKVCGFSEIIDDLESNKEDANFTTS